MRCQVEVVQGHDRVLPPAGVHVVIDVIRAFTVAQVAFLGGASEIILAKNITQAKELQQSMPDAVLAGEISGLAIPGFALDNSPVHMQAADVAGRSVIQMTTNGVQAAVRAMAAEHIFVTGFSNARLTAQHIRKLIPHLHNPLVRLIASHPTSDDDVACADFMRAILCDTEGPSASEVSRRIIESDVARKFLDPAQPDFDPADLDFCAREMPCSFVMSAKLSSGLPTVKKEAV